MITIINLITLYLIGVILAENQLLKQNIDQSEHKYKWLSWICLFTILLRKP